MHRLKGEVLLEQNALAFCRTHFYRQKLQYMLLQLKVNDAASMLHWLSCVFRHDWRVVDSAVFIGER